VLLVLALAAVAVSASVVETETEIPVMIPRATDAPAMVTAFTTRGGKAAALEVTTLLIDGKAASRITRVEGTLSGKNAEFTLTLSSMTKPVRRWLRSFVTGKYKKRALEIITKTPGTGAGSEPKKPLEYTKYSFSGVLIRELQFPAFGVSDGVFKVRVLAQTSDETANVQPIALPDSTPVRSQFFKLALASNNKKGKSKGGDKSGARMGKSVYRLDSFSLTRGSGLGKQDTTHITAYFPATSEKKSVMHEWSRWFTKRETTYAGAGGTTTQSRDGKLTLYYWSGASMDATAGEAAAGQLRVLFELTLKDVRLDKLEAGDGKATLAADKIEMSKH